MGACHCHQMSGPLLCGPQRQSCETGPGPLRKTNTRWCVLRLVEPRSIGRVSTSSKKRSKNPVDLADLSGSLSTRLFATGNENAFAENRFEPAQVARD